MATLLVASPTLAQKSKDTLRIASLATISKVDPYITTSVENIANTVLDTLVVYNEHLRIYEPLLAEAYRRVNPTTLEFNLRKNVLWHDGEPFDADDVVYTINYLIDPNVKLRFKHRWEWIDHVEKIDRFTIRIVAKKPTPTDIMILAYDMPILPKHVHGPLINKVNFGENPIGTGSYRFVSVDVNKGVVLARNDRYYNKSATKDMASIGKVHIFYLPEVGTRVAQLLTGGVDIIQNVNDKQADVLGADPRFTVLKAQTWASYFLAVDARGRSGTKALLDERVRRAFMMAMDRNAYLKLQVGNWELTQEPKSLCNELQAGCGFSVSLPAYDPKTARALLAEAGYDNLKVVVTGLSVSRTHVELTVGYLREIGVEANANVVESNVYRDKLGKGDIQMFVGFPLGLDRPDVSNFLNGMFAPGRFDLFGDPFIHDRLTHIEVEMNDIRRRTLVRELIDHAVQNGYLTLLSPRMTSFVHTKEVVIHPLQSLPGYRINNIYWK